MVVLECHVNAFGKLKDKTISLRPGLNIITGDNETGKTTIADFLKSMLFGLQEGEKEYAHYLPYEFDGVFGGRLKVLKNGSFYEITRDFLTNTLTVVKTADNTALPNPEAWMMDATAGLTKAEFEKSGYVAQNAFLYDAERYKESVEKDEARKSEERIKNHYLSATTYLTDARARYLAKQDESVAANLKDAEDRFNKAQKELTELEENLPKKKASYEEKKRGLQRDIKRVNDRNHETAEALRNDMLREKKVLEKYVGANERAARRKNIPGIILLILGVLAGIWAWFYRESNGIMDSSHKKFDIFVVIAAIAAVLLLVGIIVTIVTFVKKSKAKKELAKRDSAMNKASDSEWDYQRFVNGESEKIEQVGHRELREKELGERAASLTRDEARLEELRDELRELDEARKELSGAYDEQVAIRQEIKAIDIAIAAFGKLGNINVAAEESILSEEATEILKEADDKRDTVISIENDIIYVVENGRRLLFSELSTSSMQEVLFSVRMAVLNRADGQKLLPLVLDESLANLDADRMASVLHYLRSCSRQILLLSCQPREKKTME